MTTSYGPWATAMTVRPDARLSSFWRCRLTRLALLRHGASNLSRRDLLRLGVLALLAAGIPLVQPVEGDLPRAAARPRAARIFGSTIIPPNAVTPDRYQHRLVAYDFDREQWETIGEIEQQSRQAFEGGIAVTSFEPTTLRVAPDGRSFAFVRERAVWARDTQGKDRRVCELPRVWNSSCHLVWSPDGTELIVSQTDMEQGRTLCEYETWRCQIDGSGRTRLPLADTDHVEDWSPDGKHLLIASGRAFKQMMEVQLYVSGLDGTGERRLTKGGNNWRARFSPDGRSVAYIGGSAANNADCWVLPLEGGEPRPLLRQAGISPQEVCWSPDSKRLAVTFSDRVEVELPDGRKGTTTTGKFELAIVDAVGGNRQTVKLPAAARGNPWLGPVLDWR